MKKFRELLKKRPFIFLLGIFIVGFLTTSEFFVRSDAFCYYNIAKAITSEFKLLPSSKPQYFDYMGHVRDEGKPGYSIVCAPGTGILLSPGIFIAQIFDKDSYFTSYNGHTLAEGISIAISGLIAGFFSIFFLYKALNNFKFSKKSSLAVAILVYLCSYAVWYTFLAPGFTHIYEFAFGSIILFLASKIYLDTGSHKLLTKKMNFLFLGFFVGGFVLLRPTNAIFAGLTLIFILATLSPKKIGMYIAGALPWLLLFLNYNQTSSYAGDIGEYGFASLRFNFLNVLFSPERGFLVYSPLFIFGVLGTILLAIKYRKSKTILFFILIPIINLFAVAFIYGVYIAWWGGGGFGARYILSTAPFFAPGIGYFIKKLIINKHFDLPFKFTKHIIIKTAFIVLIVFNLGTVVLYRITPVGKLKPPEDSVNGMVSSDRYTPLDIWLYNVALPFRSEGLADYLSIFYKGISGGSSLAIIAFGLTDIVSTVDSTESVITFKFFSPPKISQGVPLKVEAILVVKDIQKAYTVSVPVNETSTLERASLLLPENEVDYPSKLAASDYYGIALKNNWGFIFLPNGLNIQYRGNFLQFSDDGFYYL